MLLLAVDSQGHSDIKSSNLRKLLANKKSYASFSFWLDGRNIVSLIRMNLLISTLFFFSIFFIKFAWRFRAWGKKNRKQWISFFSNAIIFLTLIISKLKRQFSCWWTHADPAHDERLIFWSITLILDGGSCLGYWRRQHDLAQQTDNEILLFRF